MRILIVEDEERLANSLREGLEFEGYATDCVYDGTDGWKRLQSSWDEYDLTILDVMLPGMSGGKTPIFCTSLPYP